MTDKLTIPRSRSKMPDPTLPAPRELPAALLAHGLCRGRLPIFDLDDSAEDLEGAGMARGLCGSCPVRESCLAYALDSEAHGFWGGLDAYERRALRGVPLPSTEERMETHALRLRIIRGTSAASIAAEYGVTVRTVERWKADAGARPAASPAKAA